MRQYDVKSWIELKDSLFAGINLPFLKHMHCILCHFVLEKHPWSINNLALAETWFWPFLVCSQFNSGRLPFTKSYSNLAHIFLMLNYLSNSLSSRFPSVVSMGDFLLCVSAFCVCGTSSPSSVAANLGITFIPYSSRPLRIWSHGVLLIRMASKICLCRLVLHFLMTSNLKSGGWSISLWSCDQCLTMA